MVSCKTLPQDCPSWREKGEGEEMDILRDDGFHLFVSCSWTFAAQRQTNLFFLFFLSLIFYQKSLAECWCDHSRGNQPTLRGVSSYSSSALFNIRMEL